MPDGKWRIDADGSLRTPSGSKIARLTRDGELEVIDRVTHQPVGLPLSLLLRLWQVWRER